MPTCDYHLDEPGSRKQCQFFEIGMPRTGTRSVCRAVQRMGLRARHTFGGCWPCERDALERLYRGCCDLDVYKGCDYAGGFSSIHWRMLVEAHPEAKFILTLRPVDKWCRSWRLRNKTADRRIESGLAEPMRWAGAYRLAHFGMFRFDPASWVRAKGRHEADVVEAIPPDRLLVLDVFEEPEANVWWRLALFLEYKGLVPADKPFPNRRAPIRCNSNFGEFGDE